MAKDYLINEGNQIGYMDSSFGTGLNLIQKKLVAGADVQKGQVVYISGDMTVSPTTASSPAVLGVAMLDTKAGQPIAVECEGLFKLTAGGAITAGSKVTSAADGKVASGTENTIGIALNDATADGDVYVKFAL